MKFLIINFLLIASSTLCFADDEIDTLSIRTDSTSQIQLSTFNNDSFLINEIRIIGNQKTKRETILKEIDFDWSQTISSQDLKFFESRILGLGLFNDVKVFITNENDKNVLIILVKEAWYIWPLPFVNIADRDWKKLTYGINLGIRNLTGRNESLNTGFSLGYDPKFYLSYFNPNFSFTNDLILMVKTSIQKRKNRSLKSLELNNQNYNERYYNFEIGLGKSLDIFNITFGSISYEYLHINEYLPMRTISNSGIDRFVSLQFNYIYDSRDFSAYPKFGSNFIFSYRLVQLLKPMVNYNVLSVETKKIFALGVPIFYFRNYSRILMGPTLPFYANSFLGYSERLRGNFRDIYESNSMIFSNIEFRFPFIEKHILKFELPYIPKELVTYNLSVDVHLFFDNAFMFNKNQNLKKVKSLNGFGFGFSFLFLPYRTLNLELAWNQQLKSQLIFDLNFPF